MPQRFIVVLGLPLAILGAVGCQRLATKKARLAKVFGGTMVACGLCSIAVTWLVVHGPLGYQTAQKYFPWTHFPFIAEADGKVLANVEDGVFLAPSLGHPVFGDVVALRPRARVVYGVGTMDYSHQVMPTLRSRVNAFYQPTATEAERVSLLEKWCVAYVYCPDTDPIDQETVAQFRSWSRLEEIASEGDAILFRVKEDGS
jgi:hypothetical protein